MLGVSSEMSHEETVHSGSAIEVQHIEAVQTDSATEAQHIEAAHTGTATETQHVEAVHTDSAMEARHNEVVYTGSAIGIEQQMSSSVVSHTPVETAEAMGPEEALGPEEASSASLDTLGLLQRNVSQGTEGPMQDNFSPPDDDSNKVDYNFLDFI